MKAKSMVSAALLAFVAASVAYLIIDESGSQQTPGAADQEQAAAKPTTTTSPAGEQVSAEAAAEAGHTLIAYYFHRTQRCRTCLKIEAYAEQALTDAFPEAIEAGRIEWRVVNVEESVNEHFVEEYQLAASAVVLVEMRDGTPGEWRNLGLVWELVGDEQKFKAYVVAEARAMLEKDS